MISEYVNSFTIPTQPNILIVGKKKKKNLEYATGSKDDSDDEDYAPGSYASLDVDSESLTIFEGKKRKKNKPPISYRAKEYDTGDKEEVVRSC